MLLSYEQMKDLDAIISDAIRLQGNASALVPKEKRKAVLNKNNSKGTRSSLALEEFPHAGKDLIGDGFEARIKTRSETAKTLLFFQGRTTPFKRLGIYWGGASRGSFRGRARNTRGTLHQIPAATQTKDLSTYFQV